MLHTFLFFIFITVGLYCGDYVFEKIYLLPVSVEEYSYFGVIAILAAGTGLLLHMYKGKMSRIFILTGAIAGIIIPVL
jgi:hypothetical protein